MKKYFKKYLLEYPDVTPKQSPNGWLFNVNAPTINNYIVPLKEAENYIDSKMKEFTEFEELDFEDVDEGEGDTNEH